MRTGLSKICLRSLLIGLLALQVFSLTACEDEDDKKISAAQACLDSSTQANVGSCTAMVAGITSPRSYLIRCSADYISQGFTSTRFAAAFQQIKKSTAGNNPFMAAMGFLSFNSNAAANQALSDCQASGINAMIRLATATSMATLIATATGTTVPAAGIDPSTFKNAIANLISTPSPATNTQLGNLASTANTAYCAPGSQFAGNKVCTTIQGAITAGNGDPQTIGAQLLTYLQNP